MDYGIQNSHHLSAAPQTLLQSHPHPHPHPHPQPQPQPQPQSQPQQPLPAVAHLYSAYYSTPNANPYPNTIVKQEDPSPSGLVYADGSVAQGAEHYAVQSGYDGQAVSYGVYQQQQQQQHAASYPYAQALAAASFQQAKRKFKIHSNILDLEEKKQKVIEGGASADAVRVCTICNVVCNSAKVFASHLSGEKHALKAFGTNYRTMAPKVIAHVKKLSYAKKSAAPRPPFNIATSFTKAAKPVQTFTCEVCKIDCNSQETLNTHKMGKKHKAKLQKLQEKITPKPSVASSGHIETANRESVKKKPSGKEGVQVKKEKVVQGGAAEEAIMICNLCDIVCNSKSVYESHITGRKHLSMIKKQETRV